jgi:hypothetical protein
MSVLPDVAHETINRCYLGKVYVRIRHRTAYWSRKSVTAWDSDVSLSRLKASGKGEQGAEWRIEELPSVVLSSNRFALVFAKVPIFESPMLERVTLRRLPQLMGDYIDEVAPLLNACNGFVARYSEVPVALSPFQVHHSLPNGGWRATLAKPKLMPTMRVISRFTQLLQR